MGKIMIVENTNMLGLKMKQILDQNGFHNIELLTSYGIYIGKTKYLFKDAIIIIVDLDCQDLDFVTLFKRMKEDKETAEIPIIFMSGKADLYLLKKIISIGGSDFILKPFETETLISKVYKMSEKVDHIPEMPKKFKTGEIFDESAVTVEWSDEFEIGVKQIDDEHKSIIDNYNKLFQMQKEKTDVSFYKELLDFLFEYVNSHFEHEEQLQQKIGFSECVEHKNRHENFKSKVNELIEQQTQKEITQEDINTISIFMQDWLFHHFLVEDKKIKDFLDATKKTKELNLK